MTTTGRQRCPGDWPAEPDERSKAEWLHVSTSSWSGLFRDEAPYPDDAKRFALIRLTQSTILRVRLEDALAEAVQRARDEGATWDEIGQFLGTSRQAAQKRWATK